VTKEAYCSAIKPRVNGKRRQTMKTTNSRTSIFARARESWRNFNRLPGMPYADYPFKTPSR